MLVHIRSTGGAHANVPLGPLRDGEIQAQMNRGLSIHSKGYDAKVGVRAVAACVLGNRLVRRRVAGGLDAAA